MNISTVDHEPPIVILIHSNRGTKSWNSSNKYKETKIEKRGERRGVTKKKKKKLNYPYFTP